MQQKFSGEVGQVAGRDVKSSNAQAHVNIHLHSGAESKQYISERQRRAIGAKVFELEAKTGVEKLMVYRRLMTRFKFQSMDQMPRDLFERVMRYLDGWIRNGSADQANAPASARAEVESSTLAVPKSAVPVEPELERAAVQAAPMLSMPAPTPAAQPKKQSPWLAVLIAVAATISAGAALYAVVHRPTVPVKSETVATPLHCEYGGDRYSVGSVAMQAGVRRQCVAVDDGTAWQKADAIRR